MKYLFTLKFWLVSLVVVLVTTIGAIVLPGYLPDSYDVSLTLDVNRVEESSDEYFTYEGFYAIQTSELFAEVVSNWFTSPNFVVDVLERAEIDTSEGNVKDFRGYFASEQLASNLVEVRWGVDSPEDGDSITESIRVEIDERLSENSEYEQFEVLANNPVIRLVRPNLVFFGMGGFLVGIFVMMLGVLGIEVAKIMKDAHSS